MDAITIIFTAVNACFALFSVICAIISVQQTRKQNRIMQQQVEAAYEQVAAASRQTEIAQQQLEEAQKPNYPTTMRLQAISNAIQHLEGTIMNGLNSKENTK